jgi:hypothetical protein
MAKQTNIFTLGGTLGGVSFYERKGVQLARKATGPKKSAIMTLPNYERTRQNISEFKGIARALASFASAIAPVKKIAGGEFREKIGRVLRTILKLSTEARGKRWIMISQHRNMLRNVEMNSDRLETLLALNLTASHNDARNSASVTCLPFKPAEKVTLPPKATHFQLVHFIAAVSDTQFNPTTGEYEIDNPEVHGFSDLKYSPYYDLRDTADVQFALDNALPGAPLVPDNVSVIQCVGIVYSELSGAIYYPLFSPTAMKIVDVF